MQVSAANLADYTTYNAARLAAGVLNPTNWNAINGARATIVAGYTGPQIKTPICGSQMFPVSQYQNVNGGVNVTIFARDLAQTWQTLYTFTVTTEQTYRLPSGVKSDGWYVRLIGNVNVYSFLMAETAKELLVA